jgi:hypothetical protein
MSLLIYASVGLFALFLLGIGAVVYWKWGRPKLWKARQGKALKIELSGHDVVAEVEWADGNVTFLGADFLPDEPDMVQLRTGQKVKVVGHGKEPVNINGVPVIRLHAQHACPVDTTVAIGAGLDEDGEYERVDERGDGVEDGSVGMENGESPPAVADGGGTAEVVDRKYDLEPPDGTVGWAFSLQDAIHRVPNTISPEDLKAAEERGRRKAEGASSLKVFVLGGIATLAFLFVIALIWILVSNLTGGGGGGGGGGSGQTVNSVLVLATLAVPRAREKAADLASSAKNAASKISR